MSKETKIIIGVFFIFGGMFLDVSVVDNNLIDKNFYATLGVSLGLWLFGIFMLLYSNKKSKKLLDELLTDNGAVRRKPNYDVEDNLSIDKRKQIKPQIHDDELNNDTNTFKI